MLSPDGAISIEYEFTQDEWARAYRQMVGRSWRTYGGAFTGLGFVGVGLVVEAPPVVICGVVWIVAYGLTVWFKLDRNARSTMPPGRVSHTFTVQGVHSQGELFDNRMAWKMYTGLTDRPDFLILLQGARFIPVPKRAFSSLGELEDFQAMAERGINGG